MLLAKVWCFNVIFVSIIMQPFVSLRVKMVVIALHLVSVSVVQSGKD